MTEQHYLYMALFCYVDSNLMWSLIFYEPKFEYKI